MYMYESCDYSTHDNRTKFVVLQVLLSLQFIVWKYLQQYDMHAQQYIMHIYNVHTHMRTLCIVLAPFH